MIQFHLSDPRATEVHAQRARTSVGRGPPRDPTQINLQDPTPVDVTLDCTRPTNCESGPKESYIQRSSAPLKPSRARAK